MLLAEHVHFIVFNAYIILNQINLKIIYRPNIQLSWCAYLKADFPNKHTGI